MLDITNPNQLIYETKHVTVEVLGGIRINKFDSLRVTLKILVNNKAIRHNLDLYNHVQVEKLVRMTAEKLEMGTSILRITLEELTNELETYRIERSQETEKQEEELQLSPEQEQMAITFLSKPKLLERTNQLIGESGVIGEEINRLVMYIIFTSRKTNNPLHCVSLGSSGAGKSHLQNKVSQLIPEQEKTEMTVLTENAFYYFQRHELKNKLLLIEDLDGAEGVLYPLRELQSKRKITKTLVHKDRRGSSQTIHLTVEGPVSVSGCTTKEKIYEDNANRSFLLYIDESAEQDERIMAYQRTLSAGKRKLETEEKARELLQHVQHQLKPIKVVNPYAEQLNIPKEVFKKRRNNAHYLQFIEAVTFYHQYQREQQIDKETGEIYIETSIDDIQQANELLKEILLRKSDQLSGACRDYFETLKQRKLSEFTNRQLALLLRMPISTVKHYNKQLAELGLIEQVKKPKTRAYWYKLNDNGDYKKLQKSIDTALTASLKNIKRLNS